MSSYPVQIAKELPSTAPILLAHVVTESHYTFLFLASVIPHLGGGLCTILVCAPFCSLLLACFLW